MKKAKRKRIIRNTIDFYGADILDSPKYHFSDKNMQHGNVSVMEHSISVACVCVRLAKLTNLKHDYSALVRGSLLHDYFNYDWHDKDHGRLHGYRHADKALTNAADDFSINPIEANMIARHMFPLNIRPPRYREGILLCIADKACAIKETFSRPFYDDIIKELKK
jgi:uncharacterized protein